MTEKLIRPDGTSIAYTAERRGEQGILYLHGLLSHHKTVKGDLVKKIAEEHNYSYLSLDYTGHGESSGAPCDFRVGQCLRDIEDVMRAVHWDVPFVVVGSSLGGWLGLCLCEKYPNQITGFVGISAGVDFMPVVWNEFFDDKIRAFLKSGGVLGPSAETFGYCWFLPMFQDAEKYLLLTRSIQYKGRVILLHGDKDVLIPYQTAFDTQNALESDDVAVMLVKGAEHGFTTPQNLRIIREALLAVMKGNPNE